MKKFCAFLNCTKRYERADLKYTYYFAWPYDNFYHNFLTLCATPLMIVIIILSYNILLYNNGVYFYSNLHVLKTHFTLVMGRFRVHLPIPGKLKSLIPVPIPIPARSPLTRFKGVPVLPGFLDSDSIKNLSDSGIDSNSRIRIVHHC